MASIVTEQLKPKVAELLIKHPVTGNTEFEILGQEEKVQGILRIVGQYSDEFVNASKVMAQEFEVFANAEDKSEALDTVKHIKRDMLAKCIVGWEDNGFFSTPYSPEEALDLLTQTENDWLVDQIMSFTTEKSNFFLVN